ncbi:MAG: demethoxyubiquinone hydroxylase family protein [Rickettsiales bacterium]
MIPGDFSKAHHIDRMIRVDHAGEYGAQRIYAGQLAVLRRDATAPEIARMAAQEQAHLARFNQLMTERRARPSALLPFWHVAGYALGAGTALLGPKAAMACTVAVESVIAEHYQQQLETMPEGEIELRDTVAQFREEEIEHHDIGLDHDAENAPAYELLSGVIKRGCRAAIWLAERV